MWGLGEKAAGVSASAIESGITSFFKPILSTFSSLDNIKDALTTASSFIAAHPATMATTVAVGAATVLIYKKKGFGIGLGQLDINFDNFIANLRLSTGLGRRKPSDVQDLDNRMSNMEAGLSSLRESENRKHAAITTAIDGLSRQLSAVTTTLNNNERTAATRFDDLLRFGRDSQATLLQAMGLNQTKTEQGMQAIAAEGAKTNAAIAKLQPH